MNYLLDTSVLLELARVKPHPVVRQWFDALPIQSLFLSVLTLGEMRKWAETLADPAHKLTVLAWVEGALVAMFEDRILTISLGVAERWGRLQAQASYVLPAIDSLVAATALHHNMILVTKNAGDFAEYKGLDSMNPFSL